MYLGNQYYYMFIQGYILEISAAVEDIIYTLDRIEPYSWIFSLLLTFALYWAYRQQTELLRSQHNLDEAISRPRVEWSGFFIEDEEAVIALSNHGDRPAEDFSLEIDPRVQGNEKIRGYAYEEELTSQSGGSVLPTESKNKIYKSKSIFLILGYKEDESRERATWVYSGGGSYPIQTVEREDAKPILRELGISSIIISFHIKWRDPYTDEITTEYIRDDVISISTTQTTSTGPRASNENDELITDQASEYFTN